MPQRDLVKNVETFDGGDGSVFIAIEFEDGSVYLGNDEPVFEWHVDEDTGRYVWDED
jgi:hypothetical protein